MKITQYEQRRWLRWIWISPIRFRDVKSRMKNWKCIFKQDSTKIELKLKSSALPDLVSRQVTFIWTTPCLPTPKNYFGGFLATRCPKGACAKARFSVPRASLIHPEICASAHTLGDRGRLEIHPNSFRKSWLWFRESAAADFNLILGSTPCSKLHCWPLVQNIENQLSWFVLSLYFSSFLSASEEWKWTLLSNPFRKCNFYICMEDCKTMPADEKKKLPCSSIKNSGHSHEKMVYYADTSSIGGNLI